eukprot:595420-Hanusia_phi.AAC.1
MQACWRERKIERPTFSDLKGMLRQQYDQALLELHGGGREAAKVDQQLCVICMEGEAQWALVPC